MWFPFHIIINTTIQFLPNVFFLVWRTKRFPNLFEIFLIITTITIINMFVIFPFLSSMISSSQYPFQSLLLSLPLCYHYLHLKIQFFFFGFGVFQWSGTSFYLSFFPLSLLLPFVLVQPGIRQQPIIKKR